MSYLQTVLTYHQPSEAEVDKAFLESHGITVCLMNANTARSELGAPFFIQLQVPGSEYVSAVSILKEANPQRFGSAERVAEIEKSIFHAVAWFTVPAVIFAVIGFIVSQGDVMQMQIAISYGGLAGIVSVFVRRWVKRKKPNQALQPTAPSRRG